MRLRVLVCEGFQGAQGLLCEARQQGLFHERGTAGAWCASECKSKLAASSAVTAICMQRVFAIVALLMSNIAAESLALLL